MIETVVIRACREQDLGDFGTFGIPTHVEYCRRDYARDEVVILLAVDEHDRPIGKVHVDLAAGRIGAAAVAPALQRRGIGTALMRAAEELASEHGLQALELSVEDANPDARRLYERLGYVAFTTDEFFYVGAPVPNPGVWMRKALT